MNPRAFIFDLDGVIINSEPAWEKAKPVLLGRLFGEEVFKKLGSTLGIDLDTIYENGMALGAKVDKDDFKKTVFEEALKIYNSASLTDGLGELFKFLAENQFKIALVSASPKAWIDGVVSRLSFKEQIEIIISLYEIDNLRHKPSPDGYLEAMKRLQVQPSDAVILEDSNVGIKSAKASGAYTMGLRANLVEGYIQEGADTYADNLEDVISLLHNL